MVKEKPEEIKRAWEKNKRYLLIAMILAGQGEWDSNERIKEELNILGLIKKIDEYLKGEKG